MADTAYQEAPWSSTFHRAKIAVSSNDTLQQLAAQGDPEAMQELQQRGVTMPRSLPRGGRPMAASQPAQPTLQDIATGGWTPPWQMMAGPSLPPGTSGPATVQPDGGRQGDPMSTPDIQPDGGRPGDPMGTPPTMPLTAPNDMHAGDPTAPIHAGADAADDVTGSRDEQDSGPDDIHPALMETAKALEQPPSALQKIIDQLMGGGQSDSSIRSNAIAKAGFSMAASRNPYFFGALGEGGNAGLEDYEKSKQEQLMNQVRAVGLGQQQEQQGETQRHNRTGEGQDSQRIDVLKQEAQLRRDDYLEKKRQFDAGFGTDQELKLAEIDARRASAAYTRAAAGSVGRRGGQYFNNDKGELMYGEGADVQPVLDSSGNPVKATKSGASGATAAQRNAKYYGDLLFGGDEAQGARFLATGKTMAPDRRHSVAMTAAQAELNGDLSVLPGTPEYDAKLQQRIQEIDNELATAGGATAPIGANAAPVATGNTSSKYKIGDTATGADGAKVQWDGTKWQPVK